MGVAGSNYGYSLMWVLVAAVFMRFVFVSAIARYQLCNPARRGGTRRAVPAAPRVRTAAVRRRGRDGPRVRVLHDGRRRRGVPEPLRLGARPGSGRSPCNAIALLLVARPSYARLERVFKFLLALLALSFLGRRCGWASIPRHLARGLVRFEMPGRHGRFDPLLVALAMIGAVGGSLMNLAYPYFMEAKGWRGPQYRRLAVLRPAARGRRDDRAEPGGLDAGGGAAVSRRPRPDARRPAAAAELGARRGRARALLPGDLRRHLHLDPRPRRWPRGARQPRLAAPSPRSRAAPRPTLARTRSIAGSSSGASSPRSSGRCPGCPTSSR